MISELQVRVDGFGATSRHRDAVDVVVGASTRLVNVFRAGRDAHDYRRREARELFAKAAPRLGGVGAETSDGS